jgi:hypothetical protein
VTDQFAVATGDSPAAPGTFDLTDPSITETCQAALFFYSHSLTNAATTDHGCLGVAAWADDGDAGSENRGCMYTRGVAGITSTADVRTYQQSDFLATIESDATPAVDLLVDSVTAIAGGVRLNVATTASRSKVTAVLFAGVARAYVSRIAATVTLAHEDAGDVTQFRPDVLIVFGAEGGFSPSVKDDFSASLGFVVDGGAHAGAFVDIDRGTDPAEPTSRVDGTTLPYIVQGTGVLQSVTFTIDATGYNHQSTVNSPDLVVLAIQFDTDVQVMTDNQAVTTGASQAFVAGFQPALVLGMSTLLTAENTTTTDATAGTAGFFAFDATAAHAYTGGHDCVAGISAGTPSVSKSRQDDKAVLTLTHAGAVAQEATLTAFTTTGWTLAFSTATAGHLTFLALGAGNQVSVQNETERISDGHFLNLVSYRSLTETEQVSDAAVLLLADGLSDLGPAGTVLEARAVRGAVLEEDGGAVAGTVLG